MTLVPPYLTSVGRISDLDDRTCTLCGDHSVNSDYNASSCACIAGYGESGFGDTLQCSLCLPKRYIANTRSCEVCPYPFVSSVDTSLTYGRESTVCSHVDLQFSPNNIHVQLGLIIFAYIVGLATIRDREDDIRIKPLFPWVGFMLYTIVPVADFISDTIYLTTNEFANVYIFVIAFLSFLLNVSLFFKFLMMKNVSPLLLYKYTPEAYLNGKYER